MLKFHLIEINIRVKHGVYLLIEESLIEQLSNSMHCDCASCLK